ncbi:MAG TPA: hexose kinase [Herpetosiphonaceae bacterium]|nr:hexose kinase [Herpetosiphonaceae bacterium]
MILTIVPNPALDKTATIAGFSLGRLFRVPQLLGLAGGKGFNVARALRALGGQPLVVGPFGGHTGHALVDMAQAEGLACAPVWIEGETRMCLTIVDPQTGHVTEIYEDGPVLTSRTWQEVVAAIRRHTPAASIVTVSGSCPPGTPADGLRQIVEVGHAAGVPVLLDTAGPHLLDALAAGPVLLKINREEAARVLGRELEDAAAAAHAVTALRERGARAVVITLGKGGAAGIAADGQHFGWAAPEVAGTYPTGSGDALFAGLAAGLGRGLGLPEAVRLGVTVGAANTLQLGAGVFDPGAVARLHEQVQPLKIWEG